MQIALNRRRFLQLAALTPLALNGSCRQTDSCRRGGLSAPARLCFTSQGRTAMIHADGTGLRYFDFKVAAQVTWQPFEFLSDGRRVLFLSMEARRDGPGKPFEEYYHQTPTHIWLHDLDRGTLTEVANRDRLATFYGGGPLINDNRLLMQVVRRGGAQIFSMNLDGSDAREFTHSGDGFPYGLSVSPDGRRVAFHLATASGYQVWVSGVDGRDRVKVAADPEHLYFGPRWSADGARLCFHDCRNQQDPGHDWADIYYCRPDGSEARRLTTGQGVWFGATYGSRENRGGGSETLCWTHDGQVLGSHRLPGAKVPWEFQPQRPDTDHFNRDYKPESARGGTEIRKVNPRDGAVTRLTQPGAGVWDFRASESPDGRHIVFCRAKNGEAPALWMMDSNGRNPRLLTRGFEEKGVDHPRWLPIPDVHSRANETAR